MADDKPGNQTAGTPDLSETELRATKLDDLRGLARDEGVHGASSLRKDELVEAIAEARRGGGRREARKDDAHKADAHKGSAHKGAAREDDVREGEPTRDDLADEEVGQPGDRGPDDGHLRTGPETSKSLKYSQEIHSLDDDPERPGRSLATTSHEVIRQWAESRDGVPATVEGTEHGDRAGVLRFDFGERTDKLRHINWEEWFRTFDERNLNFVYQEERKDGRPSTFFILENPDREDA